MRTILRFDRFELDLARGRLSSAGRRIRLQPQPAAVLATLLARAGETVSRAELQATLWPDGRHVEVDTALNTAVRKVRRVLGDSASDPHLIQTVPGVGYRFIGEVQTISPMVPAVNVERPSDTITPGVGRRVDARAQVVVALVLVVLTATLTRPAVPGREVSAALIAEGVRLLTTNAQPPGAARARLESAVARDPQSAAAWGWLALTYARIASAPEAGDASVYQLARRAAERALALDEHAWPAHAALGYVLSGSERKPALAVAAFSRAISEGAFDPRVFVDGACALKSMGRPELSLAIIETGLKRAPRSAILYAHRGLYLHAVHRYDEELPAMFEALALDPRSAEVHFQLGLAYARRQQYADSLASLQMAVSLSNGASHIRWWLGHIATEAARHS